MNYDERMKPYYERYDKAVAENDVKELEYLNSFCPVERKDKRRVICMNMDCYDHYLAMGYTEKRFNEHGWLEPNLPMDDIQVTKLGKDDRYQSKIIGILHLPNGKWVARVGTDYSGICDGETPVYISVYSKIYETKAVAWNTELMEYINWWEKNGEKKYKEAVKTAKSLLIRQYSLFDDF